jgi:hypothetical protein
MHIRGVTRHAQDRAAERLGRPLAPAEWLEVQAAILERRAVVVTNNAPRIVYSVPVLGVVLRLVWNEAQACIVTVLPYGASRQTKACRQAANRKSFKAPAHWKGGKRIPAKSERPREC